MYLLLEVNLRLSYVFLKKEFTPENISFMYLFQMLIVCFLVYAFISRVQQNNKQNTYINEIKYDISFSLLNFKFII